MEQELDLRVYLAIARRRFIYFLLPALLITAGSAVFAYKLPRSYEATATILVESQRIPSDLVAPTVTADASERVKVIEQRLMARDNLLAIADKFGLYRYQGNDRTSTTVVNEMRRNVSIRQMDVGRRSSRNADIIGFKVAFQYRDAGTASRVTNELVTSILTQNVETRLSRASETSEFFEKQLGDLESQLLSLESRIADFKRENEDTLPETLSYRRMQLAQLTGELAQIEQRLRLAEQNDGGTIAIGDGNAEQLQFRLQTKQINYNALLEQREKFGSLADDGYVPEQRLVDLDRQIQIAEIELDALLAQLARAGIGGTGSQAIESLRSQRDELSARAEKVSDSIKRTPTVEVTLAAMNRDYKNLQDEYRQTKSKLLDAVTGERLEQDRQAERFEVLEQATVPDEPTKPNRKKIILAGSFGGIGLGIALAALLELLNNSIRTVSDLERRLQLRPIGVIPYIVTPAEKRRGRIQLVGGAAAMLTIMVVGLAAIHFYYLPLDFIAERGWQKIQARLPIVG